MNGVHLFQLTVEAIGADDVTWNASKDPAQKEKERLRKEYIKRTRIGSCTFAWISTEDGLFLFTPVVFVMKSSVTSFIGVTVPPISYSNRPKFTLTEVLNAASTNTSLPLIVSTHYETLLELDVTASVSVYAYPNFKAEFTGSMAIKALEESAVIELSYQLTKEEYESAIAAL